MKAIIILLKLSLKSAAQPPLLTVPGHGAGMQKQALIMAWLGFLAYLRRVTGLRPLVASKGYSLNANVEDEKLPYIRDVLEYLTNAEIQAQMAQGNIFHTYHSVG